MSAPGGLETMKITATIANEPGSHEVVVTTNGREQNLAIAPKSAGRGSSVNGGELLFAALATCYCNDVYREAAERGIAVRSVRVEVEGEFGEPGEAARNIRYRAFAEADADPEEVAELLRHVDTMAEIQNTLREGVSVVFDDAPPN
jgi:uncharacterized OsmC-like protein